MKWHPANEKNNMATAKAWRQSLEIFKLFSSEARKIRSKEEVFRQHNKNGWEVIQHHASGGEVLTAPQKWRGTAGGGDGPILLPLHTNWVMTVMVSAVKENASYITVSCFLASSLVHIFRITIFRKSGSEAKVNQVAEGLPIQDLS